MLAIRIHPWQYLFLMVLSLYASSLGASAQDVDPHDSTDWPTVISKLQQEAYQWPRHDEIRSQLAIAYNNYGVSLGNEGKWDLAVGQLQEAMRLDTSNQQFSMNLCRIYLNKAQKAYADHDIQAARTSVNRAISLNRNLVEAYV